MKRRNFWRGDTRFWSPILITSGLTVFFFGVSYSGTDLCIGWFDIVVGVAMVCIGFSAAPKRPKRRS
jgi:hypothetical protein